MTSDTDRPDVQARPGPASSPWRRLLLRLHFYAGVLVAPFLVVAAVTGLGFVLTPQLDRLVYGDVLRVDPAGRQPLPLSRQVAAALATRPDLSVQEVDVPDTSRDSTRVVFADESLGDKQRTVFVDPYTAAVLGEKVTWWGSTPLTTWLDLLHKNLHLGEPGRVYTELAASWLWVLALGGLALWWGRARGRRGPGSPSLLRRLFVQDLSSRKVRRTRGWHATTGTWMLVGLVVLSATGLTWSPRAGARFEQVLDALDARRPDADTTLSGEGGGAGAGHHHDASDPAGTGDADDMAGMDMDGMDMDAAPDLTAIDAVVAAGARAGATRFVAVTPPSEPGHGWLLAEGKRSWPVAYDQVVVDPSSMQVTQTIRFADWSLLAQLSRLGIQAHMGYLFGWVNQALLIALAVGIVCVVVWGYRMWWQRRPTQGRVPGKPPARGAWRDVPRWQLGVAAVAVAFVGWALPVLGLSLVGFLVLDAAAGLRARRRA